MPAASCSRMKCVGRAQDVAVVRAGQAAVAGDDDQRDAVGPPASRRAGGAAGARRRRRWPPARAPARAPSCVYGLVPTARFSDFWNFAVAIICIVLVILRMFRTALRRLTIARALAIGIKG